MGKKQSLVLINPPPRDGRCECCGRHASELKPFGKAGDPLVGDFDGVILLKTFREIGRISKENEAMIKMVVDWDGLFKTNPKLADELSFYDQVISTVGASWECRDCIVLDGDNYWDIRTGKVKL